MPSTQIVEVAVEQLTKFGYKDASGYVSYSKKLSDDDKLKVVPGAKFEGEYYVADSGTRYLNKVFKTLQKADTVKIEKPVVAKSVEVKTFPVAPAKNETMSKAEWADKDVRISRQGVIQAAVRAVSAYSADPMDCYEKAVILANHMLKFVNEVK
jgi:hypothetical protein